MDEVYNPTDDAATIVGLMLAGVDYTDDEFVSLITARNTDELLELVAVLGALSTILAALLAERTGGDLQSFLSLIREIDVNK